MKLSTPDQPWATSGQQIVEALDSSIQSGLNDSEVKRRRQEYGPNRLRQAQRRSAWAILLDQFKSLIVLLLIVSAALSFVFGQWVDGIAIIAVILINAAIGFGTELRAVRSMEALRHMGSMSAKVRREGQIREASAEELVPGDIVVIESGDVITADLRLLEASKLQTSEGSTHNPFVADQQGLSYSPHGVREIRNHLSIKAEEPTTGESKADKGAEQEEKEDAESEPGTEDIVDETARESFPASDPPSWTSSRA